MSKYNEEEHPLFLILAEDIIAMRPVLQQRSNEAFGSNAIKDTTRNRVLIALPLKALGSFDRLVVDARDRRSECSHHLKTMVEMIIYLYWVRGDESDVRARQIYADACRSTAVYSEDCATVDSEHEHDMWGQVFRILQAEAFSGIEKPDLPSVERVAGLADVRDYYRLYRATCQIAHLGDLPIYMPSAIRSSLETGISSFGLKTSAWALRDGINLACDLLQDVSDVLAMGLDSEIESFRQRSLAIRESSRVKHEPKD